MWPSSRTCGRHRRVIRITPSTFVWTTASSSSGRDSENGARPSASPALLKRMSIPPSASTAASTKARLEDSSVTSSSSATSASIRPARRAPPATSTPASRSRRTVAAPIPDDAPVTTAVLPRSSTKRSLVCRGTQGCITPRWPPSRSRRSRRSTRTARCAIPGLDLDVVRRRVHGARRPVGLRQDDRAAHGRRPRGDLASGVLRIGDRVVNHVPSRDRDIAMVFQSYALYPHLSVYENIAFGLRVKKVPKDEIERRVQDAARVLDLEPFLKRKPRALSGGQRQRVAMGRAIVRQPQAFLMDEPLSNLDAKLRVQMRAEIARLQHDLGVTTIYVTHDQVEAMTMGDRVAVMRKGELQQVADPQELYDRPVNLFVGGFIGSPCDEHARGAARAARTGTSSPRRLARDRARRRDASRPVRRSSRTSAATSSSGSGPRTSRTRRSRPTRRPTGGSRERCELREALGSEVMVHLEVDAPPALTEDVRELAQDIGRRRDPEPRRRRRQDDLRRPLQRAVARARGRGRGGRGRHPHAPLLRSRDGSRDLRHDPTQGGRMTRFRLVVTGLCIAALAATAAATASQRATPSSRSARPSREASRSSASGPARSRSASRRSSTASRSCTRM